MVGDPSPADDRYPPLLTAAELTRLREEELKGIRERHRADQLPMSTLDPRHMGRMAHEDRARLLEIIEDQQRQLTRARRHSYGVTE